MTSKTVTLDLEKIEKALESIEKCIEISDELEILHYQRTHRNFQQKEVSD